MGLSSLRLTGTNNPAKQASVDWGNAVLATIGVGLFSEASGAAIPSPVTVVRTSGHSTEGTGAAEYVYDASVNSATVAANPLTQFLAADGRGFKLSPYQPSVCPEMFGGVNGTVSSNGNDYTVTDNTTALRAFFAWVAAQSRAPIADFRGAWGATADGDGYCITINQPLTNPATFLCGAIVAMVGETGEAVIFIEEARYCRFLGTLVGVGTGAANYTTRGFKYGIQLGFVANSHFDHLAGNYTLKDGVWADGSTLGGSQINTTIREVRGKYNGSACRLTHAAGANAYEKPALAFSAVTNTGATTNQRSELTVSAVADETSVDDLLYINGRLAVVTATSATSITVFPWVTADVTGNTTSGSATVTNIANTSGLVAGMSIAGTGIPASTTILTVDSKTQITLSANATATNAGTALACGYTGSIRFAHGATFKADGGNNASMKVDTINGQFMGFALNQSGLYGFAVTNVQAQTGTGCIRIGRTQGAITAGTQVLGAHNEGGDIDLLYATEQTTNSFVTAGSVWGGQGSLANSATAKTQRLQYRNATGTIASGNAMVGAGLHAQGSFFPFGKLQTTQGGNSGASESVSNRPSERRRFITKRDTVTLSLEYDESYAQLGANANVIEMYVAGSGSSFQPTGTITVQPNAAGVTAGYTVNGGASLALSGLKGPVMITAVMDDTVIPYNWRVSYRQVVARETGWTADTGTAEKGAQATYTAPTISATPTQAEVQAIADALQSVTRQMKAVKDALINQGTLGA